MQPRRPFDRWRLSYSSPLRQADSANGFGTELSRSRLPWRVVVILESLAAGVFAIILSLSVPLIVSLVVLFILIVQPSQRRPSGTVGWDFASVLIALCGPHWKLAAIGAPIVIFGLGFGVSLWFFSKRLRG